MLNGFRFKLSVVVVVNWLLWHSILNSWQLQRSSGGFRSTRAPISSNFSSVITHFRILSLSDTKPLVRNYFHSPLQCLLHGASQSLCLQNFGDISSLTHNLKTYCKWTIYVQGPVQHKRAHTIWDPRITRDDRPFKYLFYVAANKPTHFRLAFSYATKYGQRHWLYDNCLLWNV
jgi:hypothetical protein